MAVQAEAGSVVRSRLSAGICACRLKHAKGLAVSRPLCYTARSLEKGVRI